MAVGAMPLFGRYTEAELIGFGGIGAVYRATDSLLGRLVALKVLDRRFADDLVARKRFIRETLAAARLSGSDDPGDQPRATRRGGRDDPTDPFTVGAR